MTTLNPPLRGAFDLVGGSLRRPPLVAFAATLTITLFLVAMVASAYAHLHAGVAFPGVSVGGVPIGGLDRAAAEAALRRGLPALGDGELVVRFGSAEHAVPLGALGRDYAMADMLDQAFGVGRSGGPLAQAGQQLRTLAGGADVGPTVTFDHAALEEAVENMALSVEVAARDAQVVQRGDTYVVVPAVTGRAFDRDAAIRAAQAALSAPVAGDLLVEVTPATIQPAIGTELARSTVDRFESATAAPILALGGESILTFEPATLRQWVRLQPAATPAEGWELVVDRAAIAQFMGVLAAQLDRQPMDATLKLESTGVVAVPGVTGRSLLIDETTERVAGLLVARADGAGQSTVELAISTVEPELSTAAATALAARAERVSRWKTRFIPGENNFFGQNIRRPAEMLDGTVVGPGETFSFLDAVGELSAERGFGPGGAIIRGRTDPTGAMGGGICSASTTLFNAALRAGYEIVERTQHSYYISRYPVGLDATVFRSGSQEHDMVFVNDSQYPLWIRGIARERAVIFEIWSIPDGRTVNISRPRIDNRRPADDIEKVVDDLAPGESRRVEYPIDGFDAWVTRTVRDASGATLHEDTFYSHYIRITGITEIGFSPEEPPADEPPPLEEPPADEPAPTP